MRIDWSRLRHLHQMQKTIHVHWQQYSLHCVVISIFDKHGVQTEGCDAKTCSLFQMLLMRLCSKCIVSLWCSLSCFISSEQETKREWRNETCYKFALHAAAPDCSHRATVLQLQPSWICLYRQTTGGAAVSGYAAVGQVNSLFVALCCSVASAHSSNGQHTEVSKLRLPVFL